VLLKRKSEKIEMLRKVPLFEELSQRAIGQIADVAKERERPEGSIVALQGAPGLEMFVLLEGKAYVERDKKTLARLKKGDCFGEMSLIDYEPRSASVFAETDVTMLVIHTRTFQRLLKDASLSNAILKVLSHRLRAASAALAKVN
jgi:CRP-like cAMP-binding protein